MVEIPESVILRKRKLLASANRRWVIEEPNLERLVPSIMP